MRPDDSREPITDPRIKDIDLSNDYYGIREQSRGDLDKKPNGTADEEYYAESTKEDDSRPAG
jgi:hypothetical protein